MASVQNCTLLGCTSAHAEYSSNLAGLQCPVWRTREIGNSPERGARLAAYQSTGGGEVALCRAVREGAWRRRCSSARFRQLSRSQKGTLTAFRRKSSTAYATARRNHRSGDDDQICPFPTTGARMVKLLKHGTLKSYSGFPHGMPTMHADQINADLLAFVQQSVEVAA